MLFGCISGASLPESDRFWFARKGWKGWSLSAVIASMHRASAWARVAQDADQQGQEFVIAGYTVVEHL